MIINGPWEVAGISDDPNFGGFENLGVAPVPAGSAGQGAPVGGHNYVVYSGMDESKADAATAFINFMSLGRVRGVHRRRARPAAGQRRRLRPGQRQRASRRLGSPRIEVAKPRPWIPEGGQFFGRARRDGHRGADPGQGRAGVPGRGGRQYKSDVVPDYSGELIRCRRGAGPGLPTRLLRLRPRQNLPHRRPPGHSRKPTETRRMRQSFDQHWYAWAMVLPTVLVLGVLVLYPLVPGRLPVVHQPQRVQPARRDLHQDPRRRRGRASPTPSRPSSSASTTTSTCSPASAGTSGCSSRNTDRVDRRLRGLPLRPRAWAWR